MSTPNKDKKCYWCQGETDLPYTYHAMGPILEKYELLIQGFERKYGEKWYNSEEIDPKLLDEVMLYDQITNTVSKGVVCADCLDKDDEMYKKFRKNE
jgi:hypothetical protein